MNSPAQPAYNGDIAGALRATLDWWREAGLTHDFTDGPGSWLSEAKSATAAQPAPAPAPKRASAAPAPAEPPPRIGGDPAAWPQDLAGFAAWWQEEPSLAPGATDLRVPPRGAPGAALMVLVPEPEAEDVDALLSGPQGRLLAAMLAAMGLREDQVYRASALPRRLPGADWAALADQGLGAVLAHHVALAAPERVVAFGGNILPLLGHDPTQTTAHLPPLNQKGAGIPILAAHNLGVMLERAAAKAAFWRRWLDWTGH